jgi:TM2 domain-containing membrane protein YozV
MRPPTTSYATCRGVGCCSTMSSAYLAAACAACLLAPASARAQSREDFARQLLAEGDYYRAISVYKELAFFATDPAEQGRYRYAVGQAYRLAQRHDLAVATLTPLLARGELPPSLRARARLQLALGYLGAGVPALAEAELLQAAEAGEQARAALVFGVLRLEARQDREAAEHFAAAAAEGDRATRLLAQQLGERALRAQDLPSRSPALAAVLSALLPGAGQLYVGHAADAIQAAGFTGAFGFATYLAYDRDRDRGGTYLLTGVAATITAVFYAANIYGAARTARYFNERQRELFLGDLRRRAMTLEF